MPALPLLAFDEMRLRERLATLSSDRQMAFVASCCERAAATYLEFAHLAYLDAEVVRLVQQCLELTWKACLDITAGVSERNLANELWHLSRADPDPAVPLSRYALDCVAVVYFAADFQLTGALESASESGRWIYNALDSLVSDQSGMTGGTADEWKRLEADPIIQREVRKQEADLSLLEKVSGLDAAFLELLRTDSRRIGGLMLRDFETYAQTRLETGPPKRLWPRDPTETDTRDDEPDEPPSSVG
jgi:uncharacterized protein YjaG (DUF416 family)